MDTNVPDNSPGQPTAIPLLDYGCTPWRTSSQRAADLYDSGVKLWRKEDLLDIEKQLARSLAGDVEKFTVRRIDGSVVHIKNPMFGVRQPIWRPIVRFQEYWRLVHSKPDGPPETYLCSYLVDWENQTVRNYQGSFENGRALFDLNQTRWKASVACEMFTSDFRALLQGVKVSKILCFALGDLKPRYQYRMQDRERLTQEQLLEMDYLEGCLTQHAIALTMADIASSCAALQGGGAQEIGLFTQDPGYSDESKDLLNDLGFKVVGGHGAGGFAELDGQSVVFSAYPSAPVLQIMADIASPAILICKEMDMVFNDINQLYMDPPSPRTRRMMQGYRSHGFPVPSDIVELPGSLHGLVIHTRMDQSVYPVLD